jgi:hypothetical protein
VTFACPACFRTAEDTGERCACGRARLVLARQGGRALVIGVVRWHPGDGPSLASLVSGPDRVGPSDWVESREHPAGSVWLWRAHVSALPLRVRSLGCAETTAAVLRALRASDVLILDAGSERNPTEPRAFVSLAKDLAPRLAAVALAGAPGVTGSYETAAEAVATAISRWSQAHWSGAGRVPADHIALEDVGGTVAGELLAQLHAATSHASDWEPGLPVPRMVPFPFDSCPAGGPTLGGAFPDQQGLAWGAFHLSFATAPAPSDGIPPWRCWWRGRLGRKVRLALSWSPWRCAPTILGIGWDEIGGERRLCAWLGTFTSPRPPVVLLRSDATAEGLWAMARSVFPSAALCHLVPSLQSPWQRPTSVLVPVQAALKAALG